MTTLLRLLPPGLSFEKVEQTNVAAADLLRLCAFLHPDAIPEEIIVKGAPYLGKHLDLWRLTLCN
ncbi:hypothetical protein EPA93_15435 [Ktedonosporobacter rubrisoli]|uniref:Uncharacterized protein n=1 Tax=Ktedonosporobacter rubrisoli TaxID=2509675 RepID=A0A4P6JPJ7_KTERU|nr:hypothetical protein [Ktedonosporobacter rubrisoli]QBD77308.1 hypothetical protein EPA93_15435 [Ktedonosporobacter rubrisoli]